MLRVRTHGKIGLFRYHGTAKKRGRKNDPDIDLPECGALIPHYDCSIMPSPRAGEEAWLVVTANNIDHGAPLQTWVVDGLAEIYGTHDQPLLLWYYVGRDALWKPVPKNWRNQWNWTPKRLPWIRIATNGTHEVTIGPDKNLGLRIGEHSPALLLVTQNGDRYGRSITEVYADNERNALYVKSDKDGVKI